MDLRIEELKCQNRQLLEELFTLKKACEGKDEELTELKEKVRTIVCPFVSTKLQWKLLVTCVICYYGNH